MNVRGSFLLISNKENREDRNMPKVSIIIPCYNIEKTDIDRCISRIDKQSFKDYEIIIIDDGSKDEHKAILDKLPELYQQITVYHQKNSGVSAARNKGVELAQGKYIVFVDADDTITSKYLSEAVKIAETTKADIVYGYTYRGLEEYKEPIKQEKTQYKVVKDEWLTDRYFRTYQPDGDKNFGRGPCARLMTKELVIKTPFQKGMSIGEDVIWNLDILKHANKKVLVDSIWYNYLIRGESVTRKYAPDIEQKLAPFYQRITAYVDDSAKGSALLTSRVAYDYTNYVLGLYLGNKENRESFISKWRKANYAAKKGPWNLIDRAYKNKDIYRLLEHDTQRKAKLLHFGVLYPLWMLKNRHR